MFVKMAMNAKGEGWECGTFVLLKLVVKSFTVSAAI